MICDREEDRAAQYCRVYCPRVRTYRTKHRKQSLFAAYCRVLSDGWRISYTIPLAIYTLTFNIRIKYEWITLIPFHGPENMDEVDYENNIITCIIQKISFDGLRLRWSKVDRKRIQTIRPTRCEMMIREYFYSIIDPLLWLNRYELNEIAHIQRRTEVYIIRGVKSIIFYHFYKLAGKFSVRKITQI